MTSLAVAHSRPTRPPQTYSRLFRPWDTLNSQTENTTTSIDMKCGSEYGKYQSIQEPTPTTKCKAIDRLNSSDCEKFFDPADGYAYGYTYNTAYNFASGEKEGFLPCNSALPILGMDPIAATLMQQEYNRVLAEEAQMKVFNARKQRPKKFKCTHCDVAFSNNGQLKGHIRIHTGERPFKCTEPSCGKTFTRNEELTRHKRIHTGLRPFACTICGKKFGRRDHLKKHLKTHLPHDRSLTASASAVFMPIYPSPYLYGYF